MDSAQTDKLILDLADQEKLAEAVSRMDPGDCAEITVRAYLDDAVNKTATFSIRGKVKFKPMDDSSEDTDTDTDEAGEDQTDAKETDETGETDAGGTDQMDKPAVMQWADDQKKEKEAAY